MKINLGQPASPSPAQGNPSEQPGKVFVDWNNMKRERETLDLEGNVIDPRTKRIIKKNEDKTS